MSNTLEAGAISISLEHGTEREARTRATLIDLLNLHDLARWTSTDRVVIDETAHPHSHPVLTLHTRHRDEPDRLLSTYLHEQIHWGVGRDQRALSLAVDEIASRWPELPTNVPDGAGDRPSTYLHVVVNALEYEAASGYLGEDRTRAVFEFWTSDHYRAIYQLVLRERRAIAEIVEQRGVRRSACVG